MNNNAHTKIKAWPFLIGRNKNIDYRTVMAPAFLCQANLLNLLAKVANNEDLEEDLTKPKKALFRQITGSKVGDFTIVFRLINATTEYLTPDSYYKDKILKDGYGRKIILIEGMVFEGLQNKQNISVSDIDMMEARKQLREAYREFWKWDEVYPAMPSKEFELEINNGRIHPYELEELNPYRVQTTPSSNMVTEKEEEKPQKDNKIYSIELLKHKYKITSIKPSPDGKILAIGDENGQIIIYDLCSQKEISRWKEHSNEITYLEFIPSDKTLISVSQDNTIKRSDIRTLLQI